MLKKFCYLFSFVIALFICFTVSAKAQGMTTNIGDCEYNSTDDVTSCKMYMNIEDGSSLQSNAFFYLLISSGISDKGVVTPNDGFVYYDEYFTKTSYSAANYGTYATSNSELQSFAAGAKIMFSNISSSSLTSGTYEIARVVFRSNFTLTASDLPVNTVNVSSSNVCSTLTSGDIRLYTDSNAKVTDIFSYLDQCNSNNTKCAILRFRGSSSISDDENNVYFDKDGSPVLSYDEWERDCLSSYTCSAVPAYSYNSNYGSFYLDSNGNEVSSESEMNNVCTSNSGNNNQPTNPDPNSGSSGSQTPTEPENGTDPVLLTDAEYKAKVQNYVNALGKSYLELHATEGEDVTVEDIIEKAKEYDNSGIVCNIVNKSESEISVSECNIPGYTYKKDISAKITLGKDSDEKTTDIEDKIKEVISNVEEKKSDVLDSNKCYQKDGKFFNAKGEEISESEWNNQCVEPAKTGASLNLAIIPIGLGLSYILFKIYKKKSLIRNV